MLPELATVNDSAFALMLVAPAPLAFVATYTTVRRRLRNPPPELLLRLVGSAAFFGMFLAVTDLTVLPGYVHRLSVDVMCAAVPCLMLVLGASWGVVAAGIVMLGRSRRLLRGA